MKIIDSLPLELDAFASVDAAYPLELERCQDALNKGLAVMVQCDKELTPFFFRSLRERIGREKMKFAYLDGRVNDDGGGGSPMGPSTLMGIMISQLRDIVRGSVEETLVVLPHLDLMTTSEGGLTSEAREVITLLYENPNMLWLAFADHSFSVPEVIENLFPHRETIFGVSRDRLPQLITQREARKLGRDPNLYQLYSHISGLNAVRLRKLLGALSGEDFPNDPGPVYEQLRTATLSGSLAVPNIDLQEDIGGYSRVKQRLQEEILTILAKKDSLQSPEEVKQLEDLVPRGMIFWGPPGTGKTLFAKAMASALQAAVIVVSGPELKSRWVGESERRLRQVFYQARTAAPAVIIFDELDSFATARGTYTGSGVEHSMVNQLLTEMDGFRSNEMVFVVGTTNYVESLDPALLRPGRFEFHLQIPYPGKDDRRAILDIYNEKLNLKMSERALEYAAKRTEDPVEGTQGRYTGDHIQALCRSIARKRVRTGRKEPAEVEDVENALTEYLNRPILTAREETVVATHEAGHALCALWCEHAPPIDKISIRSDLSEALGFVSYADRRERYVTTRLQLLDSICVLYGGREAEDLLLDDLSIGAAGDIDKATDIARALVEEFGLSGDGLPVRTFTRKRELEAILSDDSRREVDAAVNSILETQRLRAREYLKQNRNVLITLRDLLLEKKVLEGAALKDFQPEK